MDPEARFEVDRDEPLALWQEPLPPPPEAPDLRAERFEFTSRGDRVPGRLLLPTRREAKPPLVLLQHGAHGAKDAPYMLQVAAPWVRAGAAVASIDLPLHGERESGKLGALLLGALGLAGRPTPAGRALFAEFVRQSAHDLSRALDALATRADIDGGRCAFAGLSLGAIVGATWCALDPRPRAVALALGGGGFGGPEADPALRVGRIAPRPLLFVNMEHDETVPRAATERLFEAAGEPKEIHWFPGGHRQLPGRGVKLLWSFLRRHLDLSAGA